MRSNKSRSRAKSAFAIFLTFLLASMLAAQPAQAKTKFKVLHTFKGSDGIGPAAKLVRDSAGNLYGTTVVGGSGKCSQEGCGTAFKMAKNGKLIWMRSFQGHDGFEPFPGFLPDGAGNFYGTTVYGGVKGNQTCPLGCGVLFKLTNTGKETVLHRFAGFADGYYPVGPLVIDKDGNLYGATQLGGKGGLGTVFKLSPAGKKTILYSFSGNSDGGAPSAGVIVDSDGNVYGTTFIGGSGSGNSGNGVVFKVDPTGEETVLHTFEGSDGENPASVLLLDATGNLYGTTNYGGNLDCRGQEGCGTVFELSPGSGRVWTENVLYTFCSLSNCTDGSTPFPSPLVRDAAGNFYGMTQLGGTSTCDNGQGCGVIFELDAKGSETVLHAFTGGNDGSNPQAGLTMDAEGDFYGTATGGGDTTCNPPLGCGTVFKITP